MNTGLISTWAGNPLEIGAMYPFVGWEGGFFVLGLIFLASLEHLAISKGKR